MDQRAPLLRHFDLTPLNASPERVRARGTVYWQAEFSGRPPPNVIKAVVGEDWIIERVASGALKFVLYVNTFHHFLPESAPLDLQGTRPAAPLTSSGTP